MKGSSHVATIFGIPVKIHWSFGLLFLWVAYLSSKQGFNLTIFISLLILFLSVFFCVVLHEFGHAMAARIFGVKTFDIIMTPIGGIARLERMPDGRGQEFWVAIAGPLVNFLIAFIIWIGFIIFYRNTWPEVSSISWTYREPVKEYFYLLMLGNIGLGTFNLIPAYPMDGGRILRSLLSLWIERARATQIASLLGQIIAMAMFAYGFYKQEPVMMLIGVFIFFAARQENRIIQKQSLLNRIKASDLMDPIEHIFFTGQSLSSGVEIAKTLKGDNYIVWSRPGIPAGYLNREKLIDAAVSPHDELIDQFIIGVPAVIQPDNTASQIIGFMQQNKIPVALVSDNGRYVGVIPWHKLVSLIRK